MKLCRFADFQCSSLLDQESRDEFIEDVADEYIDIREDHYDNLKDRRYLTLEQAREKRPVLDWSGFEAPRPTFLGTQVFRNIPLEDLVPFIDWKCFFDVWQLRGKYPNGRYPKIFQDKTVGAEARKVFDEAQVMLEEIIRDGSLEARAVVGFYPAQAKGDDISLFVSEEDVEPSHTLYGLRQQAETSQEDYCCMSDFVAPEESGKRDYIGMFAVSAGFGCSELCKR